MDRPIKANPWWGEFAYQCKCERENELHSRAQERAEHFFVTLRHDADARVSLGTTKTGILYRPNGNTPQSHE